MKQCIPSELTQVLCVIIFMFQSISIVNVLPLVSHIHNYFIRGVINEIITLYTMSSLTAFFAFDISSSMIHKVHLISSKVSVQDDKGE